jgi:HlyD family secretion protein
LASQKHKSRKWLWIGGASVAVVVILSVVLVAKGSGTKLDPSHLGKVTRQDIARSVVATGKVTPITEVELKSKASGIVTKL